MLCWSSSAEVAGRGKVSVLGLVDFGVGRSPGTPSDPALLESAGLPFSEVLASQQVYLGYRRQWHTALRRNLSLTQDGPPRMQSGLNTIWGRTVAHLIVQERVLSQRLRFVVSRGGRKGARFR
jgi:hypothetical protein